METEGHGGHGNPFWFVSPGETDYLAWLALAIAVAVLYGVVYLYARFDRWAEHTSASTPLAKTIPTMLTVALLYEIFPLHHLNVLLPASAILLAFVVDLSHWRFGQLLARHPETETSTRSTRELELKPARQERGHD